MTDRQLADLAYDMLKFSYVPYSRFPVGAAILCADGTVFTGCNIENAAYSPTLCAERVAVGKAVSEGHTDFVRIVVAGRSENFCTPCGVCRQLLYEFNPDMEVISLNAKGEELSVPLRVLLPHGFGPDYLLKE